MSLEQISTSQKHGLTCRWSRPAHLSDAELTWRWRRHRSVTEGTRRARTPGQQPSSDEHAPRGGAPTIAKLTSSKSTPWQTYRLWLPGGTPPGCIVARCDLSGGALGAYPRLQSGDPSRVLCNMMGIATSKWSAWRYHIRNGKWHEDIQYRMWGLWSPTVRNYTKCDSKWYKIISDEK